MSSRNFNLFLLVLNVGLLAGTAYFWLAHRPVAEVVPTAEEPPPATNEPVVIKMVEHEVVTNDFHWGQLESEDYRTYIGRLRSIGCPEQTIRDIIIADLDKVLAPRVALASGHRRNLKYWQPEEEELANDWDPREVARKMQEIDQQKREVIQELVGADLVRERLKQRGIDDYYERRLGFLPDEKQTQLRRVLESFDEQERAIRDKEIEDGEPLTAQDKAALQKLNAQREAEVATLLSPDERQQYNLWMSASANAVRHSLYGMNATEQDFQAIYAARKQLDEHWGQLDPDSMDPRTRQQFELAKNQVEAQLKGQLGDEKFRQYKRGEDEDYHRLSAALTRLKMPHQKADEIYDMKQALAEARQLAATNGNLTAEQRNNLLRTLSDETERAARQVLGEKGYNSLVRSGSAQWLQN